MNGKTIKSDSNRRYSIGPVIKAGGQAVVYHCTEKSSGQKGVYKKFHDSHANSDTVKRTRFLIDQDLRSDCPVILGPTASFSKKGCIGHYTSFAPGQELEEFLQNPNSSFGENLQLAAALAHAVSVMHDRKIAHGDIQAQNLRVNKVGSVLAASLIDLDNFNAPGMPAPPMVGHILYLSPELRQAMAKKQSAVPDIYSDRYSLGVMMHEILLWKHPATGLANDETSFQEIVCQGRWAYDPASGTRPPGPIEGFPSEVLNADLARLFRMSLSLNPQGRPAPGQWEEELSKAINLVCCCSYKDCGCPFVVDISKIKCPLCGRPFPALNLVTSTGKVIILDRGATVIGRVDLGGSAKISSRHAVFRRIGPDTWLEARGRNGTYRWNGSGWIRFPDRKPWLVQGGDRLRFGDVEASLRG